MSRIVTMNSPGRPEPQGFSHVSIAEGSKMVFLAGQVAEDEDGNVVGEGDLAAQVEQALVNVYGCLEVAGATFADVAKTTIYVVDWDESKLEQIIQGTVRAAERLGSAPGPVPVTLIPVPRLFSPNHLVEIESTAVIG